MTNKDLAIEDVASLTGIKATTLRTLARNGRLPGAYKLGGSWRVNRAQFERHRNNDSAVNRRSAYMKKLLLTIKQAKVEHTPTPPSLAAP